MRWRFFRKERNSSAFIQPIAPSRTGPNAYLIISGNQAAVIDISGTLDPVKHGLKQAGAELKYILITHAHSSHVKSVPEIKEALGGTFCMHPYEHELLKETMPGLEPDQMVKDKSVLNIGDTAINVLHTPGHTKGSVCFHIPTANALFSGSTMVKGGFGKIWGPNSMSLMLFSLKRLNYSIYGRVVVYPGRGETTTMESEGWMDCLRSA